MAKVVEAALDGECLKLLAAIDPEHACELVAGYIQKVRAPEKVQAALDLAVDSGINPWAIAVRGTPSVATKLVKLGVHPEAVQRLKDAGARFGTTGFILNDSTVYFTSIEDAVIPIEEADTIWLQGSIRVTITGCERVKHIYATASRKVRVEATKLNSARFERAEGFSAPFLKTLAELQGDESVDASFPELESIQDSYGSMFRGQISHSAIGRRNMSCLTLRKAVRFSAPKLLAVDGGVTIGEGEGLTLGSIRSIGGNANLPYEIGGVFRSVQYIGGNLLFGSPQQGVPQARLELPLLRRILGCMEIPPGMETEPFYALEEAGGLFVPKTTGASFPALRRVIGGIGVKAEGSVNLGLDALEEILGGGGLQAAGSIGLRAPLVMDMDGGFDFTGAVGFEFCNGQEEVAAAS